MTLFEDGEPGWTSKVVVGKTQVTETPEFDGVVRTVVVNPTWHIPDSIAIRDYLPKLQRNPMVLKNQGIDLMTRARHGDQPASSWTSPSTRRRTSPSASSSGRATTMRSAR